ncbi:MAG: AAA family ATPase, partial [Acetobacteraceae bacterium]|nr:AAA family ATPase [Acetobacteraceae bacterium]
MRLAGLTLTNYGNFADERFIFDPTPGRLNLVLAPNAAGKSVLRQAFSDLLCGIHPRSPMDFRYGYPGMRLMAEAVLADGRRLVFGRRKGTGNTLVDADGAALDRAVLDAATGPVDRAVLERLFALDTALLREGGRGLLASGGALAEALVSAAGGLRQARAVLDGLRGERDALAPLGRAPNRPLARAVAALAAARGALREATFTPEAWARAQAALDQATARRAAANAAAADAASRTARLERVRRIRPHLAAHDAAEEWLAAHPDAPTLPPGLAARLAEARGAAVRAEDGLARARARHAELASQYEALAPDPDMLAEAAALTALEVRSGAAEKAVRDLPGVAAEHAARLAEAARLRGELGGAAVRVPPQPALRAARRLIVEHGAQEAEHARLSGLLPARRRELAATREALAALPPAGEVAALEALRREIGDPDTAAADAALARAEAEAARCLALVPRLAGDAAALAALVVPSLAEIEQADAELAEARRAHDAAAQRQRAASGALAAARARLAGQAEVADLIDPDAVAAARRHRDRGWDLVFRTGFGGPLPTADDVAAWSGGEALPIAYVRAVTAADGLADRRQALAGRIAEAAVADRAALAAVAELAEAEAVLTPALAARDAAAARWNALCRAVGQPEGSRLAVLRDFLARREAALAAAQSASLAATARAALAARHAGWQSRLAAALAADPALDLPALLAEAERRLEQRDRHLAARAAADEKLRAANSSAAQVEAELDAHVAARAAWQQRWQASQAALGRDPAEAPAFLDDVLSLYDRLDATDRAAAELAARIAGMNGDIDRFGHAVAALAARLGLRPDDPIASLRLLRARADAARDIAQQRAVLARSLEQAEDDMRAAATAQADAATALRAAIAGAGAEDAEGAERRIALAEARAAQAAGRDAALAALRAEGDGLALAALHAEAATHPAEMLAQLMEEARQRADAAREDGQAASADAASLAGELARHEADLAAVTARADEEAAIAELGQVLDQALLLHGAASLLEYGLKAVEQAGSGGILARIGAHFIALTGGAYASVVTGETESGAADLRVVLPGVPDAPKSVDQLSEGTR